METKTYSVPGMRCSHCQASVTEELEAVEGVESVDVDLESKFVKIKGRGLDESALLAAIAEAGYEVAT